MRECYTIAGADSVVIHPSKDLHMQIVWDAMEFVILGKDWRARKHRGKEVMYLLQFCGAAEGDEDWIAERRIR